MGARYAMTDRTCTGCGRGVADGATFSRQRGGYRARCTACDSAYYRRRARMRRGWSGADLDAPPRRPATAPDPAAREARNRRQAALYRDHAARERALAAAEPDPIYARRLRRAADDWESLARQAEAGVHGDHDEEEPNDWHEDRH